MVKIFPMSSEQVEEIAALARNDVELWDLVKKREKEPDDYFTANPLADRRHNFPTPTISEIVSELIARRHGADCLLDHLPATMEIRRLARIELGDDAKAYQIRAVRRAIGESRQ